MLITTLNGKRYFEDQREKIEDALETAARTAEASITWSGKADAHSLRWREQLGDRKYVKPEDFCVFVKENGYMILALWAYKKLSKADKKKIDKGGYEYIYIPEA